MSNNSHVCFPRFSAPTLILTITHVRGMAGPVVGYSRHGKSYKRNETVDPCHHCGMATLSGSPVTADPTAPHTMLLWMHLLESAAPVPRNLWLGSVPPQDLPSFYPQAQPPRQKGRTYRQTLMLTTKLSLNIVVQYTPESKA